MKTKILIFTAIILFSLMSVAALSIRDVTSSPTEISPGQIADVSIRIRNIFSDTVKNLNVKLILEDNPLLEDKIPFAPYQSSSEKFLDELDSDDDETFKFKLIALPGASSGIYKIPVTINYANESRVAQPEIEATISLTINSDVELKVFLEDSVTLIKGKENQFSIKVINSGLADIKFSYLTVGDVNGLRFLSEKEQYIGDINSDDFDSVDYKVYISPDVPNIVNLPVTLTYRDATNKEFSENTSLLIRMYSMKDAQGLGLISKPSYLIYFGVGIAVVAFLIYRYRKKKKQRALKGQ